MTTSFTSRVHPSPVYILWDWNGTLLDDIDAEVGSLNAMLMKRGIGSVSVEFFREHFSFPARSFYRLVGMDVPDSEWDALAREYHDTYHKLPYGLNRDAFAALDFVRDRGAGQSVISALHQSYLDQETNRFGVRQFMDYIYGTDNLDGGSKLSRARELLALFRSTTTASNCNFILIGDSIHDYEVANELGIGCVLFSGGSHSRARLERFAPVGDTLSECVRLAFRV